MHSDFCTLWKLFSALCKQVENEVCVLVLGNFQGWMQCWKNIPSHWTAATKDWGLVLLFIYLWISLFFNEMPAFRTVNNQMQYFHIAEESRRWSERRRQRRWWQGRWWEGWEERCVLCDEVSTCSCSSYHLHIFNIVSLVFEIPFFFLLQLHGKSSFLPKMFVSFLTGLLVLTVLSMCLCLCPHAALCSMLFLIVIPIFVIGPLSPHLLSFPPT